MYSSEEVLPLRDGDDPDGERLLRREGIREGIHTLLQVHHVSLSFKQNSHISKTEKRSLNFNC